MLDPILIYKGQFISMEGHGIYTQYKSYFVLREAFNKKIKVGTIIGQLHLSSTWVGLYYHLETYYYTAVRDNIKIHNKYDMQSPKCKLNTYYYVVKNVKLNIFFVKKIYFL